MLPDFGWSELLVIAIVLIVVVGPKDLPKMLRTFGKTTSNLRKMAGDFRRQFDDALKEAELDDVREIARDLKGLDPRNKIRETLNPLGKVGQDISSELKKTKSDLDKSDKPKSDKPSTPLTADSAKTLEASSAWLGDSKPAAESKTANKTAAKTKAAAKTASKVPAKTAAARAPATKSAAAKTPVAKTPTTRTAPAKPTASKAASAKPASAKPAGAAAKPKAAAGSGSKASTAGAKAPAKPKAAAKSTKTAGKDQS